MPIVTDLTVAIFNRESKLAGGPVVSAAALVVVFNDSLALLLLGERNVEVEVELAAERGRPGECPPHPPLVRLQLGERRPATPPKA